MIVMLDPQTAVDPSQVVMAVAARSFNDPRTEITMSDGAKIVVSASVQKVMMKVNGYGSTLIDKEQS